MNFLFKPDIPKGWILGYKGDDGKYHYLERGNTKQEITIALALRVIKAEGHKR